MRLRLLLPIPRLPVRTAGLTISKGGCTSLQAISIALEQLVHGRIALSESCGQQTFAGEVGDRSSGQPDESSRRVGSARN